MCILGELRRSNSKEKVVLLEVTPCYLKLRTHVSEDTFASVIKVEEKSERYKE
jgi:hypothetical protein